jgi:type 1 glutamine amidotransferase
VVIMSVRTVLALLLVAVAGVPSLSTQPRNKRIVIIAGRPSHGPGMHEFRAGSLLLQKALAGVKGVTVEVIPMGWPTKTVDGKEVDDGAALDGADAVFIYADGGDGHPAIQNGRVQVIDALAKKGVGLGFGHYGVEVPVGEPAAAMHRWVGGYYETNYSVNPMWAPNFATFPSHPVTRGVGPFSNKDEWYFNMRWTPDERLRSRLTPLLVATPSDEVRGGPYVSPRGPYAHIIADKGRAETMMWVFERPDGGRSFGFTGGHTHANWGDVNQRRIVLNALLWIAKLDVPSGGVVDTIAADDLTVNLDPKPMRKQ